MRQLNSSTLVPPSGDDHQPGVEKTGVGDAFLFHAAHHRLDHLAQHARMNLRRDHRRGRIRAHAAGVGAVVAIQQALVILAGRHRQYMLAIDHHDEAGFFAFEELLDHHPCSRVAQFVVGEHHVYRDERFALVHRDYDALARREAIGLDDDRRAVFLDVCLGCRDVAEGLEERGGDVVAHHETLGEILGGFELRGGLRRAEYPQSGGAERIHHTCRQRRFRPDHGHVDVFALHESDQIGYGGDGDVFHAVFQRRSGVARRDIHLLHFRALRQTPGQRMFASAGTDDQNFHCNFFLQHC